MMERENEEEEAKIHVLVINFSFPTVDLHSCYALINQGSGGCCSCSMLPQSDCKNPPSSPCSCHSLVPVSSELFKKWKGYTSRDHPSIIQVLLESGKDTDVKGYEMPNLVYVCREKCGTVTHNFKVGALNTLIRVSSTMSNAPVILTLDCDMYSNDPRAPYRAMCYLMDPAIASKLAFVQFPQKYQGINKHDIYGGEMKRLFAITARGMDRLQGPNYVGTCCFFSRRSFYGPPTSSMLEHHELMEGRTRSISSQGILKQAYEVASCTYELGTKWGSMVQYPSNVDSTETEPRGVYLSSEMLREDWFSLTDLESFQKEIHSFSNKLDDDHVLNKFQPKSIWYLTILGTLATTQREYIALHAFRHFNVQMQTTILKPSPEYFPKYEEQSPSMPDFFTLNFTEHLHRTFNGP